MKVYLLIYETYYPYEGGDFDIRGVYSTRKLAREAALAEIRKDWPNAKRDGRKDEWDLDPAAYDDYSLRVDAFELDA